jgi:hypothetical protein
MTGWRRDAWVAAGALLARLSSVLGVARGFTVSYVVAALIGCTWMILAVTGWGDSS